MKMSVNILQNDPARNFIWIFYNDYSENSHSYSSYLSACNLLNLTILSTSNTNHQNIHCITTDSLEAALNTSKSFGFKYAFILLPGTVLRDFDPHEFISSQKQSLRLIADNSSSLLGYFQSFNGDKPFLPKDSAPLVTKGLRLEKVSRINNDVEGPQGALLQSALKGQKIYLYNNEAFSVDEVAKFKNIKPDFIIVPASGFYANDLVNALNLKPQKIIYYDNHSPSLELKKSINLERLTQEDILALEKNDFVCKQKKIDHESLHNGLPMEDFYKLEKDYFLMDLIVDYEQIIAAVQNADQPWIWISNIYTFNINIFKYGPMDLFDNYLRFINRLKETCPQAIVHGKDPWGKYFLSMAKEITFDGFGNSPSWSKLFKSDRSV